MSDQIVFPELARNIRTRREEMERSLSWVARKAGVSKTYLWELERDTKGRKQPSIHVIWKLADVLNYPMEVMLGEPKNWNYAAILASRNVPPAHD